MHFTVDIPGEEPSRIEVYRNPVTGSFRIVGDDKVVAERSPLSLFTHFSRPNKLVTRVYRYEFHQHHVLIEHVLPLFLAGFRPQTFRVFVDGALMREQRGY